MMGDVQRRIVKECRDLALVVLIVPMDFRGHRIFQREFDGIFRPVGRDDGACISGPAALEEMGDDIGIENGAHGLERQKLGIARPGAHPDQLSRGLAHIPGLASALSAAAVMALPPRRPSTMAKGTP